MPITPPNFNVQQISPASLLAGQRQRQDDPIDSIVNEFINFSLRERLQDRSLEAYADQQEAQRLGIDERTFMQDVNERRVVPVPDEGFNFETPEGDTLDIPTFEGPPGTRFEGQQYAAAQDVLEARRQIALAQPAGEGYFEGTTLGDLVTPTGSSISEGQRQSLRLGDRERVLERYEAFANEVEAISPNLAEAVRGEMEAVRRDKRFTESEEQDFLDRATLTDLGNMNTMVRNIAELEAEKREEINGYVEHATRNLGLPSEDGRSTRPLKRDEKYAYAMWRSGNTDMMDESDRQTLEEILPDMRALPTAPDIQQQITDWYLNSGRTDRDAHLDFVGWVQSIGSNDDGSVRNQQMRDIVTDVTDGSFVAENISEWATRPEAARFRAAYALWNNGRASKSSLYELATTGFTFPHSLEGDRGINSAFRVIYGDDWDTFATPPGGAPPQGGLGSNRGSSNTDLSTPTEDMTQEELFSQGQQLLQGSFQQMQQSGGEEASRSLAILANSVGGSGGREDLVGSLRQTADGWREDAQRDQTSEEQAEVFRQWASAMEELANVADSGWGGYTTVRDSVFIPALKESGAVDHLLDLSSY